MKENKTEEIYFIARVVGRYFALKRYAVCKECALPWQKVMLDAGSQRADILCVDKNLDFVIVETKSSQNMTQKELSEKTGIPQADISRLENGTRNPTLKLLKRLADGLNMELGIVFVPKKGIK